jgi:hypothetical protein
VRSRPEVLDLDARISYVVQPAVRILFQASPQQVTDRWRRVRRHCRPVRLSPENGRNRVSTRVAREYEAAGQHLVQHAPERPDVRAFVDGVTARLFRAHIGRRTDDPAGLECRAGDCRHRAAVRRAARKYLCHAEVEHLDVAVVIELDVGGLQIAVNDPLLMCGFDGLRNLQAEMQHVRQRQPAASPRLEQPFCERRPVHQLHGERMNAVGVFEPVDRRDARMIQRRQQPGLARESLDVLGIACEGWRQDLEGDVPPERGVVRPVHLSHPPAPINPSTSYRPSRVPAVMDMEGIGPPE